MDRYVLGDTDGSRVGGTQRAHMTHVSLTPRPAGIIAMAIVCYRLILKTITTAFGKMLPELGSVSV
jgi:hypothetical protein